MIKVVQFCAKFATASDLSASSPGNRSPDFEGGRCIMPFGGRTSLVIVVEHLASPSFGFLASHSTLMLQDPRAFIERLARLDVILQHFTLFLKGGYRIRHNAILCGGLKSLQITVFVDL